MNELIQNSHIFKKASFFVIKKDEAKSLESLDFKIVFPDINENIHAKRREEYHLGRLCAAMAYKSSTGLDLLSLPSQSDRSPLWPSEVVGSISHNSDWVGAAVAQRSDLLGVGIDFEAMGRARAELSNHIRSTEDLLTHPQFSEEELLTIIFSAKESLYKALYPTVRKFFGLRDAAVRNIDEKNGEFTIDLLTEINSEFGPAAHFHFNGRFLIKDQTCFTAIEILPI